MAWEFTFRLLDVSAVHELALPLGWNVEEIALCESSNAHRGPAGGRKIWLHSNPSRVEIEPAESCSRLGYRVHTRAWKDEPGQCTSTQV